MTLETKIYFFMLCLFAAGFALDAEQYFNGSGRNDLSMQIEKPTFTNIGEEVAWLPDFVVNTITDDIKKYSGIQVADAYNAKVIAEAQKRDESAAYSDSESVEAGNFAVARQILLVSIIGKGNSYAVSVRINDKEKNTSLAAYSNPSCSYQDLDSGKALKEAVFDILGQLGVELTERGKSGLLAVRETSAGSSIEAQKLVAKGNVAASQGSNIQALTYYIEASAQDAGLERAVSAMSSVSQTLAAGDFGTRARNLIQQRNEFVSLVKTVEKYYKKNPPCFIVYTDDVKMGKIDYEKEIFNIDTMLFIARDFKKENIYNNVYKAYKSNPNSSGWRLDQTFEKIAKGFDLGVTVQVKDKNGTVLGQTSGYYPHYTGRGIAGYEDSGYYNSGNVVSVSVPADSDTSSIILEISDVSEFYTSEKVQVDIIPRSDFMNHLWRYLPIEFVSIPGSDYMFVKNTKKLEYMLDTLRLGATKVYQRFYPEEDRVVFRAVFCYRKTLEKLSEDAPFKLFPVKGGHNDYSNSRTQYPDDIEEDDLSYEYDNMTKEDKNVLYEFKFSYYKKYYEPLWDLGILPIYAYKPEYLKTVEKEFPKMQKFTSSYRISKDAFSETYLDSLRKTISLLGLPYVFSSSKIESDSDFELAVNALNEIKGYEPFLLNSFGDFSRSQQFAQLQKDTSFRLKDYDTNKYARSANEIAARNYDTDGYIVPRESDWKEAKREPGKFFVMKKK